MERFAPVALGPRRVVLALAHELSGAITHAARGVPVTLAPAAYLQVGHCVEVRVILVLCFGLALLTVQAAERDADVRGRDPVLEHG